MEELWREGALIPEIYQRISLAFICLWRGMKKIGVLVLVMCMYIGVSVAHQPRLVFKQPMGQIIEIQHPEDSQAFYGILSGQEDVYQIIADTWFVLYVNLVVPNISGNRTDFVVDIIEWNASVYTRLDGKWFARTDFFEPYGGDSYLQGPSREKKVWVGTYTIRVSNPTNQGKYSLAIGKRESFPIKEIINTYRVMPELKMVFFEKSWYMTFRSIVGIFLVWWIVVVAILVWWITKTVKYIRYK